MTAATVSALLSQLRDYYARHGVLPSYATLSELAGFKAKSWAHTLVRMLRDEGFVELTPQRRLKPGPRFFERELAESVRAGLPDQVPDTPPQTITIDSYLISRPSQTSLVRVKGDSMINAGILDGDLAVVEWRTDAWPGNIVVAVVDGDFTLKYLDRDRDGYFLRAANDAYPVIRTQGRLEVSGVMVGLVRRL
ncbi:MAG: S24 family peptidase [Betaproteobacteria bacterium]